MSTGQLIVLALLLLPLIAAVAVWCLGPARGQAVRSLSALTSVVMLVLALALVVEYAYQGRPSPVEQPTFVPEFVPGSLPTARHQTTWNILPIGGRSNIQLFLG